MMLVFSMETSTHLHAMFCKPPYVGYDPGMESFMGWGPTRKNLKVNDCKSILQDFKQFCYGFSGQRI